MKKKLNILMAVMLITNILSACSGDGISISYEVKDASIFRGTDGNISINAKGGSGKYEYSIDNGVTWKESNSYKALPAGTYYIKVRDKKNKKESDMIKVNINQPDATRPEVYVGVADNRMDQLNHPDKWTYVRENANGFYINFIELDSIYKQKDLDI